MIDLIITSDTKLYRTPSDAEDAGAAQDWSIADTRRTRFLGTTWDPPESESLQIAVYATPNPTTVAVGNYGQPDGGDASLTNDHAQAFTTGADGYRLTQVDLEMLLSSGTEPTYTVRVHSDSASGAPGKEVGRLTKLDSPTATPAKVRFTAAGDGLVLVPNTTYWVVVDVTADPSANTTLGRASGKGEDAGAVAGWSIADTRLYRSSTISSWSTETANVLKIAVHAAVDDTPPEFSAAAVNGAALTVSFDEDLDTGSVPAPGDFHVTVGGSRRNVASGGVAIAGAAVTLTLESAAVAADTVKVRYTRPSANPLRDIAGNEVATFADQPVINTTGSLVSNAGQAFSSGFFGADFAQAFTTGSHPGGYTLSGMDVYMRRGTDVPNATTAIHVDDSGVPGDSVESLVWESVSIPSTKGAVRFAADSDGIALEPNTTYWLVIDLIITSDTKLYRTPSDAEDAGAAQDWSIADTRRTRFLGTTWDPPESESLQIAVYATPNPTTVAVGNYGQPDGGDASLTNDHAQAFTTGADGYRLTQVDLEMLLSSGTEPTYTVRIHSDSASGAPGKEVGRLTKLDSPTATPAKVRFTAAGDGLVLVPNTTYWVVVDVTADPSANTTLGRASGKGEDAGAVAGWSIADTRLYRSSTISSWSTETANVLKIAVHATQISPLVSNTDQPGDV